ncbi:MAG: hypothetical protein K8S87_03155 [Planctomycetes bacterium]|nr:hypothetical protein [Planctomycetota bacterium]
MHRICPSCMGEVQKTKETCPKCGWQFPKIPTKPVKTALNNTEDSEKESVVASDGVNKAVKHSEKSSESLDNAEISQQNAETLDSSTKTLNLGICIDRTGSSELFQRGIHSACKHVFEEIEPEYDKIRCFMQSHGDLDNNEEIILHTDGGTTQQTLDDIQQISFEGGGDPHETHLDGIENLLRIVPWVTNPANSRSAMIVFLTSDTKPAKSGASAKEIGAEIAESGITLYMICELTPTSKHLCDAAGGFMFPISRNPDPELIARISKRIGAHILSGINVPVK